MRISDGLIRGCHHIAKAFLLVTAATSRGIVEASVLLTMIGIVAWHIRFCLMVPSLIGGLSILLDQWQEELQVLAQKPPPLFWSGTASLTLAALACASSAWYWARTSLELAPALHMNWPGANVRPWLLDAVGKWGGRLSALVLPALLCIGAQQAKFEIPHDGNPLAVRLCSVNQNLDSLTAAVAVASALLFSAVVFRRRILRIPGFRFAALRQPTRLSWLILGADVLVFTVLTVLQWLAPTLLGPMLGAPTYMMLWGVAVIGVGSMIVQIWLGHHVPVLMILVTWILILGWLDLNDNHAIGRIPRSEQTAANIGTTPAWLPDGAALNRELFARWLESRPDKDRYDRYPVFLVSAEGGGIRAAYWTAHVLASLEDQNPGFSAHVFAISGVSGGSLGAALFAAMMAEDRQQLACPAVPMQPPGTGGLTTCVDRFFDGDFLSPIFASALTTDLLQKLLPWPIPSFDRARALEASWTEAWERVTANHVNAFAQPFDRLWAGAHAAQVPLLMLNTTVVETGQRGLIAPARIPDPVDAAFPAYFDVRAEAPAFTRIPLSALVHMSARFPFFSPAGFLRNTDQTKLRFVDGGYFENSGTTTTYYVARMIVAGAAKDGYELPIDVHFITITNSPGTATYRNADAPCVGGVYRSDPATEFNGSLSELSSPIRAVLNTKIQRARESRELLNLLETSVGGGDDDRNVGFVPTPEFFLVESTVKLPIVWHTSAEALCEMKKQFDANDVCRPASTTIAGRIFDNSAGSRCIAATLRPAMRAQSALDQRR